MLFFCRNRKTGSFIGSVREGRIGCGLNWNNTRSLQIQMQMQIQIQITGAVDLFYCSCLMEEQRNGRPRKRVVL